MPSVTGHRIWFHGRCTAPSYSCVEIVKISRGYPPLNWIAATCGLSLSLSSPHHHSHVSVSARYRGVSPSVWRALFLHGMTARRFVLRKGNFGYSFYNGWFRDSREKGRLSLSLLLRDNRKWIGMVVSCRVSIDNYARCFLNRDWHVSLETCILSSEVNDKNKLRFISRQRRNVGYKRFYLNSSIYQSPRVI